MVDSCILLIVLRMVDNVVVDALVVGVDDDVMVVESVVDSVVVVESGHIFVFESLVTQRLSTITELLLNV